MDDKLAQELYSESLELSNLHLGHSSTANGVNEADIQAEDGSLWGGSDEELDKTSDLDREWQRRHDQFHTIGYRDGLIAGKEASAQEGFNIGFKQSVSTGYNWGLTRGVTSALACLPDELRETLIETQEKRDKFRELYESVNLLSATDALKLFHDDILRKKAVEQSEYTEASVGVGGSQEQSSNSGGFRSTSHSGRFRSTSHSNDESCSSCAGLVTKAAVSCSSRSSQSLWAPSSADPRKPDKMDCS